MQAMANSKDVFLNEEMVNIVKKCGPALTEAIQSKFGCTTVIHGVDVDSESDPSSTDQFSKPVVSEKRYSIQLSRGVTVSVWRDDLTTHRVDAVVNAANTDLYHAGGLARALCDAGGQEIQRESRQYIDKHGQLRTGDAVVTKAGSLPCKVVIHAVGPNLPYNPTAQDVMQATPLLQRAVENILQRVKEEKVKSVAIPALSSGIFNFPLPRCAETIVTTLKRYNESRHYAAFKTLEIRLVNKDEESVSEMMLACTNLLGTGSMGPNRQTAQDHGPNRKTAQDHRPNRQTAQDRGKGAIKGSSRSTAGARKPSSTAQMGNITLTLKRGNIENEKADVIVNTTSKRLNLSEGEISNALLWKAGYKMQEEVHQSYPATIGSIISTKGYHLDCQKVYHAVCVERREHRATQILQDVIEKCLKKATSKEMRSISFPAIGTGCLGFQKKEVAEIMMRTVCEFGNTFRGTITINFVIYPNDDESYKAFEDELEMNKRSRMSPPHSSNQGFVDTSVHHKSPPETPYIELSSDYDDRIEEARRWIDDIFCPASDNIAVYNNFIQYLGQLQHAELQSLQAQWGVSVTEVFQQGRASILVAGARAHAQTVALEVEAMCCRVQEEFAKDEERTLALMTNRGASYQRTPVEPDAEISRDFAGFQIVRVEKMENPNLKHMFELKKRQLRAKPQKMYQQIPAEFCDLVSRVGFQRECSPPDEQKYGAGIYFSGSVAGADKLWRKQSDVYLYFVKAQVLIGRSTAGSPELIVPPPVGSDPLVLFDSVYGGADTHVVFNSYQALPEYLITCRKDPEAPLAEAGYVSHEDMKLFM